MCTSDTVHRSVGMNMMIFIRYLRLLNPLAAFRQ